MGGRAAEPGLNLSFRQASGEGDMQCTDTRISAEFGNVSGQSEVLEQKVLSARRRVGPVLWLRKPADWAMEARKAVLVAELLTVLSIMPGALRLLTSL